MNTQRISLTLDLRLEIEEEQRPKYLPLRCHILDLLQHNEALLLAYLKTEMVLACDWNAWKGLLFERGEDGALQEMESALRTIDEAAWTLPDGHIPTFLEIEESLRGMHIVGEVARLSLVHKEQM